MSNELSEITELTETTVESHCARKALRVDSDGKERNLQRLRRIEGQVLEVIENAENGLLVDFFSVKQIADRIDEAFAAPERIANIRMLSRATIVSRYDLKLEALPNQLRLIERL